MLELAVTSPGSNQSPSVSLDQLYGFPNLRHGCLAPYQTPARQVLLDSGIQPARFGLLLAPLGGEAGHLLLEGFAVVFLGGGADVAAGGEDVGVFADFLEGGAFAEAGDVGIAIVCRGTLGW